MKKRTPPEKCQYFRRVFVPQIRTKVVIPKTPFTTLVWIAQLKLCWFNQAVRRPEVERIRDVAQANWRPAECMDKLLSRQTWKSRLRTERKSLVSSHRANGHGAPPPETWSTQVVMAAQPAPSERHHGYKSPRSPTSGT